MAAYFLIQLPRDGKQLLPYLVMLWGGSAPDQIVPFTSGPGESSPLSTWVPAQPPALISLVINILRLHLPGTAQHNKSGVTSVLPDISELYLVSPSLTALVLFLINWSLAWGGLRTEDWGLDKSPSLRDWSHYVEHERWQEVKRPTLPGVKWQILISDLSHVRRRTGEWGQS